MIAFPAIKEKKKTHELASIHITLWPTVYINLGNFVVRRPTSAGPLLSLWGALGLRISDTATLNGRLLLRGGLVLGNGFLLSRRLLRGGVLFPSGRSLCNTRFFLPQEEMIKEYDCVEIKSKKPLP
jgi:hypothetical protein